MAPDLGILRGISKKNLDTALGLMRGNKILIIESKLTPTLDLIADFQFLRDHGVVKVFQLETCEAPRPMEDLKCTQALYLIRSSLVSAKYVCNQINSNRSRLKQGQTDMTYGVVIIPRQLHIITALFESEGVYEFVKFGQYAYEFIPLDEHILSLQLDDVISNFWLHQDTSYLPTVAQSIFNLRGIFGEFHHLIAVGPYSRSVVNLMNEFEVIHKNSLKTTSRTMSEIPTLIIMDRSLDFVSPLLTPLTYEAMLDEIFGIKGKVITFETEVTGKGPVKHMLTSSDEVFEKVRNLHFSKVVQQLLTESKNLKDEKEKCSSGKMDVKSMKDFVENKLRTIQRYQKTLGLHLGALDVIIKEKANNIKKQLDLEDNILENTGHKEVQSFLEDSMAKGLDPITILRLACLTSLAQDGVKDCRALKTQFIQSYGYNHLATLHNLEKMDLMYPFRGVEVNAKGVAQVFKVVANSTTSGNVSGSSGKLYSVPFQTILKKLTPPSNIEVNFDSPDHPSYIFNGKYTPLLGKLVEEILQALSAPNSNVGLIQKKLEDLMKFYHINDHSLKIAAGNEVYGHGRNVLVLVIGGITRVEIAALQLIGKRENTIFNVICGGTDITNGKKIIQELMTA